MGNKLVRGFVHKTSEDYSFHKCLLSFLWAASNGKSEDGSTSLPARSSQNPGATCEEMETQRGHAQDSKLLGGRIGTRIQSSVSLSTSAFQKVVAKLVTEQDQCVASHALLLCGLLPSRPHHLISYSS